MRHILIFSLSYYPFMGGGEVYLREIMRRLQGRYRFSLITARYDRRLPEREKIDATVVHRVGFGHPGGDKLLLPAFGFQAASALHQKDPIHLAHALLANHAGLAALFFKLRFGMPLLLSEQSGDAPGYVWRQMWFVYPLFRRIYQDADAVQVLSDYLAQRALDFGASAKCIFTIPNGVDLNRFHPPTAAERRRLRRELGFTPEETIIISTSRLELKNGLTYLVRAMAQLPNSYRLLLIGRGGEERKLRYLTRRLHLASRIRFLGYLEQEKLPPYLQAADIFVRPSLSEGLGNSFLEAMACGLPIIGTPVGGIPEFLTEGRTGLFCRPQNPRSIASAIEQLGGDASLRRRLSAAGVSLLQARFTWDSVAAQTEGLYGRLLGETL